MSDERPEAPRRARRAAEDDARDSAVPDDTPAEASTPGRPGGRFMSAPGPVADDVPQPEDTQPDAEATGPVPVAAPGHAAFMRPGSATTAATAQTPAEPAEPSGMPAFVAPGSAPEEPDAAPVPDEQPAVAQPVAAPAPVPAGAADEDQPDELTTRAARNPWPTRLLVGVVVLALGGGAAWLAVRQFSKDARTVTVTQTPSSSATPSRPDAISDASLVGTSEAAAALGGGAWTISETLSDVQPTSPQVTCMTNPQGLPNAQITRQRVLTSSQTAGLGALQRIDAYATEADATQAYSVRLARLSACDDVPAHLESAASISGLADQSFSMVIAYQDPTVQYRTVVISRTGTAVSMMDVTQPKQPVEPAKVAAAVVESSKRLATSADGTAPATLAVRAEVVPPTPIFGWLAQSDIPRITAGQGIWNSTQVAQVTTKGSQCENVTLASVTGPTGREQRSYLLEQDSAAPEAFGVDQVRFAFKDDAGAKAFAETLYKNIASCGDRLATAKISGNRPLSITGQDRQVVTGRVFTVTQATSENSEVYFRVAVVVSGNRVSYLVSNTRKNFDFTDDSWLLLAARSGQRVTQSR
ncbi:hypothetical protein ACQB6R_10690 [Propionibacteriaceae bacterium G1746]|uniref:hypothetical protein n=1 Tax=Aestuariimicrobium sp. G57 TaxID=3418485 RepID=UPI003C192E2A